MKATVDRAAVARAYQQGESVRAIVARTGHSQSGVYKALNAENVDRHHPQKRTFSVWTVRQETHMKRLYAEGHSLRDIGEIIGKSWTAVAAKRKALKLHRPDSIQRLHASRAKRNVWSEAEHRSLTQLFHARHPYSQIAKMLGRTLYAVRRRAMVLGLSRPCHGERHREINAERRAARAVA